METTLMNRKISRNRKLRDDGAVRVKTGGQWLIKLLQKKDVQFVFGTTGAGMPDIQDAMVVEKPPKWIQGLHEFVSISAAAGYALASGREGVALIDRIVGTQNAVGAFYGAYMNCSPTVILASSNVPGVPMETGAVELHFSSHQSLMVAPWVKWSTQVNSLETLPEDIDKAFFMALSETTGPVYVTLRQDLMARRISRGRISQNFRPFISRTVADDETIEKIIKELVSHDHPEVLVSHLGRNPDAVGSLIEFAHAFGVSVKERRFFMNYPTVDSLHLGFVSRYTPPQLSRATDLAIALETGLLPHQGFGKKIDAIDLASDPFHRQDVYAGGDYGSSLFPALARAACDVGQTLNRIVKMGRGRLTSTDSARIRDRAETIAQTHEEIISEWRESARRSYESGKLDDFSIGYVINKHYSRSPSLRWVNGAASSWETLLKTVEVDRPGSYFGNPSGHLGVGVGMAYGVALANKRYGSIRSYRRYKTGRIAGPEYPVLCTVGDGDAIFGNISSALWTCSHYGIGVVFAILNNACWAAEWTPIEESSQHWARDSRDFEFLDIDQPRIDFCQLARAFAVETMLVKTPQDFDSALGRALKLANEGRPVLLDLKMEKFTKSRSVVL
ncbi:MAG: hypothetical protein HYY68_09850 [Thaumarchaeota archaeon]|nr:hypothetical protein [Nitrososphaerota archaeon]